jgi:Flp pilus assembly protein TadB
MSIVWRLHRLGCYAAGQTHAGGRRTCGKRHRMATQTVQRQLARHGRSRRAAWPDAHESLRNVRARQSVEESVTLGRIVLIVVLLAIALFAIVIAVLGAIAASGRDKRDR